MPEMKYHRSDLGIFPLTRILRLVLAEVSQSKSFQEAFATGSQS